jgi:hypothetical protein
VNPSTEDDTPRRLGAGPHLADKEAKVVATTDRARRSREDHRPSSRGSGARNEGLPLATSVRQRGAARAPREGLDRQFGETAFSARERPVVREGLEAKLEVARTPISVRTRRGRRTGKIRTSRGSCPDPSPLVRTNTRQVSRGNWRRTPTRETRKTTRTECGRFRRRSRADPTGQLARSGDPSFVGRARELALPEAIYDGRRGPAALKSTSWAVAGTKLRAGSGRSRRRTADEGIALHRVRRHVVVGCAQPWRKGRRGWPVTWGIRDCASARAPCRP